MPVFFLVFEFLGTTELMMIALVALIIFGPRKLPEIGRMLGKSLGEFKRASDDFKRTWEYEVELDSKKPALANGQAAAQLGGDALTDGSIVAGTDVDAEVSASDDAQTYDEGQTIARTPSYVMTASVPEHESKTATDEGATSGNQTARDDDELNAS